MNKSLAEEAFAKAWQNRSLNGTWPALWPEYQFCHARKWRFDFAIMRQSNPTSCGWAVEIEGEGRHRSFGGFRKDCEKYNAAAAMGWTVFRFPATTVVKNPEGVVAEVWQLICGSVPQESVIK